MRAKKLAFCEKKASIKKKIFKKNLVSLLSPFGSVQLK